MLQVLQCDCGQEMDNTSFPIKIPYLAVLKEAGVNHPEFWDDSVTKGLEKRIYGTSGKGGKAGTAPANDIGLGKELE